MSHSENPYHKLHVNQSIFGHQFDVDETVGTTVITLVSFNARPAAVGNEE